jgi:glycosyltransferase involved in cell wall biosynthesis
MKIGLMTYQWQDMESLHYLSRLTDASLRLRHEVSYCPPQYLQISRSDRLALMKDWVAGCDVLVVPVDELVLTARDLLTTRKPPAVLFLMGGPSRGGRNLAPIHQHVTTADVFIGNCEAEVEQARLFLPNATLRQLPFPVDDAKFHVEPPQVADAARRHLGLDRTSKIIVYSGRIALEKNVHAVLKVFSVVRRLMPDAVLVIAGGETNAPFAEFGVFALEVTRMLTKVMQSLGLDTDHVRFVGQRSADELRALYNAADVVLNLTLNHDENFGLAQVEAMLCGTRVVGTTWGGLRDTIVEGVTGRHVSTVLTQAGVKVNWWEAARTVVDELCARRDRDAAREQCRASAIARYSLDTYRESLEAIVAECVAHQDDRREPVPASAFAKDLWSLFGAGDCMPPYRRGPRALELYRQLVRPQIGAAASAPPTDIDLDTNHVVCLATPLVWRSADCIAVNDPIFPMELQVPGDRLDTVTRVVQMLQRDSVTTTDALAAVEGDRVVLKRALDWLSETGLVLISVCDDEALVARSAGASREEPVFTIVPVDHQADVLYVH